MPVFLSHILVSLCSLHRKIILFLKSFYLIYVYMSVSMCVYIHIRMAVWVHRPEGIVGSPELELQANVDDPT